MTQIVQAGQINTAGLIVPDAIIQIVPPGNRPIVGVPTNVLGIVGTAVWGPVGLAMDVGGNDQQQQIFGPIQARLNDLGTAVFVATQQGGSAVMKCVRATDGSDLAAAASINDNASAVGMTLTGKYTGSLGNQINVVMGAGTGKSTSKCTISMPFNPTETFDNLSGGIFDNTVVAGTGYSSVPTISFSAPQLANGVQAKGTAQLIVVGAPTIGAGGSGYAINDTITLPNGVVIKVDTVSGGAVATFHVTNTGSLTSGNVPANPVAQTSTSGTGTGATFNLTWGLGKPIMTQNGSGYTSATCTLAGGGSPTGSPSVTPVVSIWGNIVSAINNGQSGIRGPSNIVIATVGSGTGAVVAATTVLSGGTDGAANVTSAVLVGQDVVPRKGIYALRGQGCSVINLADLADSTQWSTLLTFALSEATFVGTSTALGDSLTNASSELSTAGVDGYGLKICFGDWVYWNDQVNGVQRLIAPATFWAGKRANLAPQHSTLNKPIGGVVGTQKSVSGGVYSQADLQALAVDRLDVLCNPAPGGNYFAFRFGSNIASNPSVNGENYTMMTNFLAKSIAAWAGSNIGLLQTPKQRRQAKASLDNFLLGLWRQQPEPMIGNAQGTQPWKVVLDDSNNPPDQVALGYEVAAVQVQYLSVIRWFIVNLEGGQTVKIDTSTQAPGLAQAA